MKPIRVLQVVTTMERAGLETMLMNYYRHIDREKVQFDFLRHRDGIHAYDEEIKSLGGNIYTVPSFDPLNINGYRTALDAFFKEHKEYGIVHSHLDCLSALPLKYAKKHGVPVRIAHAHTRSIQKDAKYPIRIFYRGKIPSVATDLFACSEAAGKWMFGGENFKVVPNAIDCERFAYDVAKAEILRREDGLDNKFVIAHVGRFDAVKNHTFLLEVFCEILKTQKNSVLVLAGEGTAMADIKAKAEAEGIEDKVRFLGAVSDVASVLQMADAFVFPSLYEGLGMSLIEAQAAGLSCFASYGCVPKEADITGTVQYLKLESGAKVWADAILAKKENAARRSDIKLVSNSGYNILTEAKKLQEYYINK